MSDDVQITKVERVGSSRRKRKRSTVYTDTLDVVNIENIPEVSCVENIPEVSCVELPQEPYVHVDSDDDAVVITSVSKRSKVSKKDLDKQKAAKRKEPDAPVYWTSCDKYGSYQRRYHLIEVQPNCQEWFNICVPLLNASFSVQRLMRIQNQTLWQRLQYERQLMCRNHVAGFDLNERLLYHTSRAATEVICAEGLDQRLSASGSFGRGIYFSDNPRKCDGYWPAAKSTENRKMFACRVLLGDIKVYPQGKCDHTLMREPPKPRSAGGGSQSKTFDSVLGNCHGGNEFVVYNTYRVMPEYMIEYQSSSILPLAQWTAPTLHGSRPSVPMCHLCGELTNTHNCLCRYTRL